MNLYSQILKDKLTPEQYNKIPPFLRHRDEPDLFYHPIYNCVIESINGRKRTKAEIQDACRIARGKKVPELLKAGDYISVCSVAGPIDQPYFCDGSRFFEIKKITGPHCKYMEYEMPEHYTIVGKDRSFVHDLIAIDGVVCSMWKSQILFIEVMKGTEQ